MNIFKQTGTEYAAFLSYANADDAVARRVHRALEQYRLPRGVADSEIRGQRNPLYPVFRDRNEAASGELGGQLQEALRASRALVVVCSPHAAASEWVNVGPDAPSVLAESRRSRQESPARRRPQAQ